MLSLLVIVSGHSWSLILRTHTRLLILLPVARFELLLSGLPVRLSVLLGFKNIGRRRTRPPLINHRLSKGWDPVVIATKQTVWRARIAQILHRLHTLFYGNNQLGQYTVYCISYPTPVYLLMKYLYKIKWHLKMVGAKNLKLITYLNEFVSFMSLFLMSSCITPIKKINLHVYQNLTSRSGHLKLMSILIDHCLFCHDTQLRNILTISCYFYLFHLRGY